MAKNQFSLENKCYALSGGTGALGGSIAEYLVQNGARVILLGRSPEKLDQKVKELNVISAGKTNPYVVDLLNEKALKTVRDQIADEVGAIDGMVNLAGGNIPGATLKPDQTIHDIEIDDTRKVVDINLFGTVLPTIVLSELMVKQEYGSIINISPWRPSRPYPESWATPWPKRASIFSPNGWRTNWPRNTAIKFA